VTPDTQASVPVLAAAVLDQLDGGVALLDQDARVVFWNDWLAAASALPAAAVLGRFLFDALPGADPDPEADAQGRAGCRLRGAVADALGAGAASLLSYNLNRAILPLRARDGSPLLHAASVKPMAVGASRFCLIQVTDVTRIVDRERLLRERRDARFRALVDAASDAILTTDPQGRILWVNGQTVQRFAHLTGGRGAAALEGAAIDKLLGAFAPYWTDPAASTVEVDAAGPAGHAMPMELSLARWQSDGRTLVTGFLRDIGERRQAQAEIAARHADLEKLAAQTRMTLDALPASVAVLDEFGTILFVNRSFAALGEGGVLAPGGSKVGENYLAALADAGDTHPDRERAQENLRALLRGDVQSFAIEVTIVAPLPRRFRCIGATIAGGPLGRAVYMLLDVTEQKQLEDALRDLNATLEARVASEIAARLRAQEMARHAEQMRTLGQLAGGMAHDFNNVLQAISGGARLLSRRIGRPDAAMPLIQLIVDAADRGASITGRLLSFAHRGELHAGPVDMLALLRDLNVVLSHTLGSGVLVQLRAPADLPAALIDKAQLETVLINLATNARDAMPHGGRLVIAVEPAEQTQALQDGLDRGGPLGLRPGRYLRLTVTDTGTGMDEATLARVSEPFFTTKPVGRGTGLGLAMARGFADQSGGALHIASAVGEGTVVTLWLPAAEDVPAHARAAHGSAKNAPLSAGSGRPRPPPTVLLVDDEALIREVLRAGLEDSGFAVVAAGSGHTALQLLDEDPLIGVLVTDLAMAEMDGMTLIGHARARRPALPVILLTGFAEASPAAIAEAAAGRFDMLRKPASVEQIAAAITSLLARQGTAGDVAPDRPALRQSTSAEARG
jgi:signal transduction histidine kinase/FixJ family two-component response regulator